MSLYDDPFSRQMKYDGTCPHCHGNPRLCDGKSGECGALNTFVNGPTEAEWHPCACECGCDAPTLGRYCPDCFNGDCPGPNGE